MARYRFNPESLRNLMADRRMGQNELARHIGIGNATLSRILNGLKQPNCATLCAIKSAYPQYSLDFFFTTSDTEGKQ